MSSTFFIMAFSIPLLNSSMHDGSHGGPILLACHASYNDIWDVAKVRAYASRHEGVCGASTYDDICGVSISTVYGARCGGNDDGPLSSLL